MTLLGRDDERRHGRALHGDSIPSLPNLRTLNEGRVLSSKNSPCLTPIFPNRYNRCNR